MRTSPTGVDQTSLTRTQRAGLPLSADVARAIAEEHGVCVRPLAMRRIDAATGRVDVVGVPCGSTREEQCRPCADEARRLGMAPMPPGVALGDLAGHRATKPIQGQQELMAARADLTSACAECRAAGRRLLRADR
jgi:hypothetical protein